MSGKGESRRLISNFFIARPIFATVLAIIFVLAGAVALPFLPVGQFPDITPPTVVVNATYTGASAEVVEASVTTPLEEQINGVEGMVYMASTSADDGTASITVTFDTGYDLDIAAVDVQNRVEIANSQLPEEVVRAGVTVTKQSANLTMVPTVFSPDGRFGTEFITNYLHIHVLDVLQRIPGVSELELFGERKYAMRIWLEPDKMAALDITPDDVASAIEDQNQEVAAGSIGQPPAPQGQQFQFTLTAEGRLDSPEQFEQIIVKVEPGGKIVRLKDVGRVELGAELYTETANMNRIPALPIGVFQRGSANSLDLSASVRSEMAKLAERFPEGLEQEIIYDTTDFVRASIEEVLITLAIAIALVVLVVFVFLHKPRAVLIPVITIPVCLIGTLGALLVLGFSINTLTLFGLVLAVGLVVDDAIVVVENVSRHLEDEAVDARVAASNAMKQVTGPIIATSLVLMAVFIPVAFTPGVTGKLYEQFALTIACAVAISAFNSLSLSPALCAVLLGRRNGGDGRFSRWFNARFSALTAHYERAVGALARWWMLVIVALLVVIVATGFLFRTVPTGFVPAEDQGWFLVLVQTPEGTSLERTQQVADDVEAMLLDTPGVMAVQSFGGFSIIDMNSAPNVATVVPVLKPWKERTKPEEQLLTAILPTVNEKVAAIPDARIVAVNPPTIPGLSPTGGFQFEIEDFTGGDLANLERAAQELMAKSQSRPELAGVFTTFSADTPHYRIDIDRTKALSEGISLSEIFTTLQTYLGGYYVNNFNKFGRVYRVYLQAEGKDRNAIDDVSALFVRNADGDMVPLSGFVTLHPAVGARNIKHYNLFRSATINGAPAPGYSSSQAIQAMEELAADVLPQTMGYEWTGNAYQEIEAGNVAPYIFALAVVFVFLFLAAQYESWSMPFMVILAVPLAMFGALGAQWLRGLENDIYCQIGLVMLIGLASKNAILIVEFARRRRAEGLSVAMAAMEAARIRLRPILMTAFAFILGVSPLVFAGGAGENARQSLGTAVFGGMIASTLLSLFVVPVFYVLIEGLREKLTRPV